MERGRRILLREAILFSREPGKFSSTFCILLKDNTPDLQADNVRPRSHNN